MSVMFKKRSEITIFFKCNFNVQNSHFDLEVFLNLGFDCIFYYENKN